MSIYHRLRQEEMIIQRDNFKRQQTKVRTEKSTLGNREKVNIKMSFFKDILESPYPYNSASEIWDKIEARKAALVKHGYWTKDGEVTDKGLDSLIQHTLKFVQGQP
jgi:hypothetical protein